MLRTVDISGRPVVAPAAQPAPHLMWVAISDLVIDDAYQRPLLAANWQAITRISENFNWSRFSPVLVAPLTGGKYAVVDGQHRAHAAAMCGFDSVPAMAVPMAPQEQAGAFGWVNGQVTRVSPLQLYRAALAAREGWAVRCHDVVDSAGCQLMTAKWSTKNKRPGMVFCLALIRGHVTKGNAWAVMAGLRAMRAYDISGRVPLYSDFILGPWLAAVASDRSFERADLVGFLRANDPFHVIARADRVREAEGLKASAQHRAQAFAALIRAHRSAGIAA